MPLWEIFQNRDKISVNDITCRAALCYGSEDWIKTFEASQMRYLGPSLDLTGLDRQRHWH
jgi:hypothetical protein